MEKLELPIFRNRHLRSELFSTYLVIKHAHWSYYKQPKILTFGCVWITLTVKPKRLNLLFVLGQKTNLLNSRKFGMKLRRVITSLWRRPERRQIRKKNLKMQKKNKVKKTTELRKHKKPRLMKKKAIKIKKIKRKMERLVKNDYLIYQ